MFLIGQFRSGSYLGRLDDSHLQNFLIDGTLAATLAGTLAGTLSGTLAGTLAATLAGTLAATLSGTLAATLDGTLIWRAAGQFNIHCHTMPPAFNTIRC